MIKKNKIKIVEKPWGKEIWFADTPYYLGKIIIVHKGCRLSKQYHKKKHETFYCLSGSCLIEINRERKILKPGQSVSISAHTAHRISAPFGMVKLSEVSTPHPDDIVRLNDDYGRNK